MQRSALSARAAGAYLGFASANPILDAIRSGELTAERRPGVSRNGRNRHSYLIQTAELDRWAAAHGLEKPAAAAQASAPQDEAQDAPEPSIDERMPETFNVSRVIPLRPAEAPTAGLVTVPLDYLNRWIERAIEAEVKAASLEAVFAHVYGPPAAYAPRDAGQTMKSISPELGGEASPARQPSTPRTRAPRRARASS